MRSIGSNRFKIDQHYVGEPPAIEITITNLNDNIDKNFLADLMSKCGATEEQTIYYHPLTKRHLGIARCVFMEVRAAQTCIDKYNGKSVMGKVLNVFHDAFGEHCKQFVLEASGEKKPSTLPFQAVPMHVVPPQNVLSGAASLPLGHMPHGHIPPVHTPHGHLSAGHTPHGHTPHSHTPHAHMPPVHTPHVHLPQGHMPPAHPIMLPPLPSNDYPPNDGNFNATDPFNHQYGGNMGGFPRAEPHADEKGRDIVFFRPVFIHFEFLDELRFEPSI